MKNPLPIDTTVYCSSGPPGRPAFYKIAAEWTGGGHSELKTYGFADDDTLVELFLAARRRMLSFRPTEGETLGELQVYRFHQPGVPIPLTRAPDVEERLAGILGNVADEPDSGGPGSPSSTVSLSESREKNSSA